MNKLVIWKCKCGKESIKPSSNCKQCNTMKMDYSMAEFLGRVYLVSRNMGVLDAAKK